MPTTENTEKTNTDKDENDIATEDRRRSLYKALMQCRSEDEMGAFLADLCTPQELETLTERWNIARLLAHGGYSYRAISNATGASTTTIGRVARFLQQEQHKGYHNVLRRLDDTNGEALNDTASSDSRTAE